MSKPPPERFRLDDRPLSVVVTALSDTVLAVISRDRLEAFMDRHPRG